MQISQAEQEAIRKVVCAGETFGYGNMIAHLQTAWAQLLVNKYQMSEDAARKAAGGDGYPFEMHRELKDCGMWDETGARYRA